jgi:hypothetical protein
MIDTARLESVVRSPETRKKISKLTSDTKAAVLEIARKDRNSNKNKNKFVEESAECAINAAEHSIHTSDDNKESLLDTESMIGNNGTDVGSGVNVNYTVPPAPCDGVISNLPLFDKSHYCSLFSTILRSRVEDLIENLDSSNITLLESTSVANCSAEQTASDEIMKGALTSLLELLPLNHAF